jgi:DNA-binding response OmpR family regulator
MAVRRQEHTSAEAASGPKVLVVDDEPVVSQIITDALGDEGFTVRTASGGVDALELLGEYVPDIVLLDLMMPRGSGEDFLVEFRRRGFDTPVAILSAKRNADVVAASLRADAFISKPFDLDELSTIVRALLAPGRIRAEPLGTQTTRP